MHKQYAILHTNNHRFDFRHSINSTLREFWNRVFGKAVNLINEYKLDQETSARAQIQWLQMISEECQKYEEEAAAVKALEAAHSVFGNALEQAEAAANAAEEAAAKAAEKVL